MIFRYIYLIFILFQNLLIAYEFHIHPKNANVGDNITLKIIDSEFSDNIHSVSELGTFELYNYKIKSDTLHLFYKVWNTQSNTLNPNIILQDSKIFKFDPISYYVDEITTKNSDLKSIKGFQKTHSNNHFYLIIIFSIIILSYFYYHLKKNISQKKQCRKEMDFILEINTLKKSMHKYSKLEVYLNLNSLLKKYINYTYFINSDSMSSEVLSHYLKKRNNLEIPKLLNKFEKIIYSRNLNDIDDVKKDVDTMAHQFQSKQ